MLTKTLALEVADKGIRINSTAPGAIATMMNLDILEDDKKRKEEESKIPMHRIGEPKEIVKVALFFSIRGGPLYHWYNSLCRRRTYSCIIVQITSKRTDNNQCYSVSHL